MKNTIHFILSYLLIMTSLPVMAAKYSDPDVQKAYEECTGSNDYRDDDTKYWDSETNRCLNTGRTSAQREAFKACEDKPDDQKEECYMNNANQASGVFEGDGKDDADGDKGTKNMATAVSAIYSTYLIISYWGQGHTAAECTSKRIFNVASIANIVLDLYLRSQSKKKFEELSKDYDKETAEFFDREDGKMINNNYEAQLRAFEYLKQEQEMVAKFSKQRATAYMALGVAYAAALGFAIYEMVSVTAVPCINSSEADQDKASQAGKDNQAAAKTTDGVSKDATTPYGAVSGFGGGGSSAGIAIASGVMTGLNVKLMSAAKDTQEDAESNAEKIQEVMDGFKEAIAESCPMGREDLSNPRCYCYTSTGDQNTNRSKSNICKNLWAEDNKNYMAQAGDYAGKRQPAQGCMTVTNKYDPGCRCKKMINTETKQNACQKTSFGPSLIQGPFANTALANTAGLLNSVPSGANNALEQIMNSNAGQGAAKINAITDAGLKAEAKKFGMPASLDAFDKLSDKVVKSMPSSLLNKYGNNETLDKLASGSRPANSAMDAVLTKANEKGALKKSLSLSGGKGSLAVRGKKKKGKYRFNWDADASNSKVQEFAASDADDSQYQYNQKQIIDNDSVSIWDVISNRYNTSGMRRLFQD
ncbi:hypothetical protein OAT67_06810 [Bacteriovoracaceae bacterium]|nr:hypothetical protein [Bacteriovoracaceae bacterium]